MINMSILYGAFVDSTLLNDTIDSILSPRTILNSLFSKLYMKSYKDFVSFDDLNESGNTQDTKLNYDYSNTWLTRKLVWNISNIEERMNIYRVKNKDNSKDNSKHCSMYIESKDMNLSGYYSSMSNNILIDISSKNISNINVLLSSTEKINNIKKNESNSGKNNSDNNFENSNNEGNNEDSGSFQKALKKSRDQALRGGLAGAAAQGFNVLALMWLRTTMNYEYRYGGGTKHTMKKLYQEGGIPRFYRGLIPALMQSPLSRFGDTAANVGILDLLEHNKNTSSLPIPIKTALASLGAASWRFFLMPLDAWKTMKQVEGGAGLKNLQSKIKKHGISKLYHGSFAAMSATFVGHYPWFLAHNTLSLHLPDFEGIVPGGNLYTRNALIGFCSSVISDTCSNSIRVVKTTKQTSIIPLSYKATVQEIVGKDGLLGLFGRGLQTRIITNGMQGIVFSVGWKLLQGKMDEDREKR